MGAMSPWHWAIVLIVLVLLFGSTRLPGAARGLGKSLRIFKSEMKEMTGEESSGDQSTQGGQQQATTPQALPAQPAVPPQAQTSTGPAAGAAQPQQTSASSDPSAEAGRPAQNPEA